MFRGHHTCFRLQTPLAITLRRHQAKIWENYLGRREQESKQQTRARSVQALKWPPTRLDLTCNPSYENETSAQFIPNGSQQAGSTADIDYLDDISELLLLTSSSSGLSTAEELICILQSESIPTQVFEINTSKVVDCIALLSTEEKVPPWMEGLERI